MWFSAMVGAYKALSDDRRQELHVWENENLDGVIATSDWPGWKNILGTKPVAPDMKNKKRKIPIPPRIRREVLERDRYRCQHCQTWEELTIDHIIPESRGGKATLENLQVLCMSCNLGKGTKS
jgi:hypothetical protein